MKLDIAVISGDGIGPEITRQGIAVLDSVARKFGHQFHYHYAIAGAAAIDSCGDPFPEETYRICAESDAVFFAAVGDPRYDNNPTSPVRPEQGLLAMRKQLGLYANIRPTATYDCLLHKSPLREEIVRGADFLTIRELTGGMYFGKRSEGTEEAFDTCIYTRAEIERILDVAYQYARKRRKHVTVVDKANILASSRLWRHIAHEKARSFPDITTDYIFVDAASMRLIQEPRFFDVIVTENTFGDILTDEGSVISGSMGMLPSASIGTGTPVFEPVHGSWPQAAGKNIANPVAMILSGAMMLDHFGLAEESAAIHNAVSRSLAEGVRTPDIADEGARAYTTEEVGAWIAANI